METKFSVKKIVLDFNNNKILKFIVIFISVFILLDTANKFFNSVNNPNSEYYNSFISENLNYIQALRSTIIICSVTILRWLGYTMMYTKTQFLAIGGMPCNVNYSCLGLGVMSFWTAFTIAFPKPFKEKIKFFFIGIVCIFILNVTRMVLLVIATVKAPEDVTKVNYQHDVFNIVVYVVLFLMIYFWIRNTKSLDTTKHTNT